MVTQAFRSHDRDTHRVGEHHESAPAVTPEQIMRWLHAVPDPEIPVISVVDLGIVRGVEVDGDHCVVTITPTYSGCPAMKEITEDIVGVLRARGMAQVRVHTTLSPPWTTDWMSARGREALRAYGIAPPTQKAIEIAGILPRNEPPVPCPQCGSTRTRLISRYGSTSCKALYRCNACREPFDHFKTH
jgi:ring-1,2-phenylacetyl-CoA epoxidase subunit PaaD